MKASKSEATRQAILEATCRCIAGVGIEKSSITAIAQEAGVSRALVAHYFPKKDELFEHVVKYVAQEGIRLIEQPDPGLSAKQRLLKEMEANFDFFLENPHYFKCFFLFYYFASIDMKFRTMNTQLTARTIERFQERIEEMCPRAGSSQARMLAESLHRELIGAIQKFFIVSHEDAPEEYRGRCLFQISERLEDYVRAFAS